MECRTDTSITVDIWGWGYGWAWNALKSSGTYHLAPQTCCMITLDGTLLSVFSFMAFGACTGACVGCAGSCAGVFVHFVTLLDQ